MKLKRVRTEQCEACADRGEDRSKNNRSVYEDGSYFCHKCNDMKTNYDVMNKRIKKTKQPVDPNLVSGHIKELEERLITKTTCEKYNVRVGVYNNEECVIYPIYNDSGRVIKQKIRGRYNKKLQRQVGDTESMKLFGQNVFHPSPKIPITITEGEYDAMCVHQATEGYPAVSGVRGASGLVKELKENLEWLTQWSHVNLCFDKDECGQEAIEECIKLFEPGKVRIVNLPLKDANEMLLQNREGEIKKLLYSATVYKPSTLVSPEDVKNQVLQKPQMGEKWPWLEMTKATYGLRWGEVFLVAGPTSVGKTEFIQQIAHQQIKNNVNIGLYNLEQLPADTIRRYIGYTMNKRFHVPGIDGWDDSIITEKINELQNKVTLYNAESGTLSLEGVLINIRYSAKCTNTKFFVVDNLTMLASNPVINGAVVNDIVFMCHCMSQFAKIARELNITIFVVAHLNTDRISMTKHVGVNGSNADMKKEASGLRWESGRMASLENIYGGNKISNLVDYVMVLARNRISEDKEERKITKVKFLKTRLDSQYEGKQFQLKYNYDTGKLNEYCPVLDTKNNVEEIT